MQYCSLQQKIPCSVYLLPVDMNLTHLPNRFLYSGCMLCGCRNGYRRAFFYFNTYLAKSTMIITTLQNPRIYTFCMHWLVEYFVCWYVVFFFVRINDFVVTYTMKLIKFLSNWFGCVMAQFKDAIIVMLETIPYLPVNIGGQWQL